MLWRAFHLVALIVVIAVVVDALMHPQADGHFAWRNDWWQVVVIGLWAMMYACIALYNPRAEKED